MHGSGDKRQDDSSGTDAAAVFGDFSVPEDADVESGGTESADADTEDGADEQETERRSS